MNSFRMNFKFLTRLSSLFLIQLLLIFAFVLFGAFVSNSVDVNEPWTGGNVKFIVKDSTSPQSKEKSQNQQYTTPTFFKIIKNDEFSNHFVTISEDVAISTDIDERLQIRKVCYKDGIHESHRASQDVNNKTDENFDDSGACVCRPEWHGSACSEPEIIWRAFMTARQPMVKSPVYTRRAHNVFYIIGGVTSVNLETLEIQILEVVEFVNLFVFCDLIKTEDPGIALKHYMNKGFLEKFKKQVLLVQDDTCSSVNIYRKMKKILGSQMLPLDVLIYSKNDEILNKKAVNYFKWHNHWHQPLHFRFRWNVYGFFFQHPENTIVSSMACQINVLEQFYSSNPDKILSNHHSPTILTVGDLNHLGGWFCEFCHQPIDIIRKLHLDSKFLANKTIDPLKDTYHRKPVVNIEYIQNLIQYGKYIDGKMELLKMRHYQDMKYFTPESVAKNRWKFDNIVTNFYASWDDDLEGDY